MKRFFLPIAILIIASACSGNEESSDTNDSTAGKEKETNASKIAQAPDSMAQDFPHLNQLLSADGYPIVFYNVENLFDTKDDPLTSDDDFTPEGKKNWTEQRYRKKVDDLVKVFTSINENMPVAIGLSEIENKDVLIDLITHPKMKMSEYLIVHEESPDTRGIDVAFLFDQNRFNYAYHETIRIDFPWDSDIKTRDILHVAGEFEGNDHVHFFVNHWPSRRDGVSETEPKRIEVAGRLREKLDEIYLDEEDPKIFLMGDFNDGPSNKSIEHVLNCLNTNTIRTAKEELADGQLFNLSYATQFNMEMDHKGVGTLVHDDEWEVLDQMMCSQRMVDDDQGYTVEHVAKSFQANWIFYKKKDGQEVPSKTYGGKNYYGGYSDHLPIYTILKNNNETR